MTLVMRSSDEYNKNDLIMIFTNSSTTSMKNTYIKYENTTIIFIDRNNKEKRYLLRSSTKMIANITSF